MGGLFGVASKSDCLFDLFFGTDYHSHLGTRRGGMAVYGENGFDRAIHNIENTPFRTKFDRDMQEMKGNLGVGCISDYEPQPLLVRSHHGTFAITTVGRINNAKELTKQIFDRGNAHFLEMSGGDINPTELVAALINQKLNLIDGIRYAQEQIDGSLSFLILTPKGIYAARDRLGRTPLVIGKKEEAYCVSFEDFAYLNLVHSIRIVLNIRRDQTILRLSVHVACASLKTIQPCVDRSSFLSALGKSSENFYLIAGSEFLRRIQLITHHKRNTDSKHNKESTKNSTENSIFNRAL